MLYACSAVFIYLDLRLNSESILNVPCRYYCAITIIDSDIKAGRARARINESKIIELLLQAADICSSHMHTVPQKEDEPSLVPLANTAVPPPPTGYQHAHIQTSGLGALVSAT